MKNKHRRLSTEERRRIVAGYEKSGLSQRDYVRRVGVGLSTLSLWRRQFGRSRKARLVEVDVGVGGVTGRNEIYRLTLPCGIGLEFGKGFDAGELRQLLGALRETD